VLYRLRADGRKVPITDGQGMDLARRKGLIQEVVVSPKRASRAPADANSAFDPQLSQPETVVLHSVELPQVQLGDREIADTPPEKAVDEGAAQDGGKLPKPLDLRSHPSLLQLQQQQQQQQSQTSRLLSECGLEPRSNSETVAQTSQGSADLAAISQSLSRISSMNRLTPDLVLAKEMAGSRSGSQTPSASAAAQQAGYMPYWGLTNSSAALPNQAMPVGATSRSSSLGGQTPVGLGGYMGGPATNAPLEQNGVAAIQRQALSQVSRHPAFLWSGCKCVREWVQGCSCCVVEDVSNCLLTCVVSLAGFPATSG